MTRFGTKYIGGLALAVAGITALAACSSSNSSSSSSTNNNTTPGVTTEPGSIGGIPAAGTPSGTAGSITLGYLAGNAPNWILPIIPAADNSVYNSFVFGWQMWRPTWFTWNGSSPAVNDSMSPVSAPVSSNGGKTFTMTFKPWKWSDGQTLGAADLAFTIDEIKAALKESPANWANYVPGYFPDTLTSMSMPNASTLVLNMAKPVNPTWLQEDIIDIGMMPAHAWAKASASGPTLDYTNPANAKKIWDFLNAQSKSVNTYATNPLWQVVYGPYKLTAFNATTGSFTMAPNPSYSGPHANPQSTFVGVPFTSDAAQFNAIKSGSVDIAPLPSADNPQIPSLKSTGYNYYGLPAWGDYFAAYNFKDTTGDFNNIVAQLYFRQAMQHLEDQPGQIKAFLNGDGDPLGGPIGAFPQSPFLPANGKTTLYPFSISTATSLLKSNGWTINANGTDTCSNPGTGTGQCGAGIPAGTKLAFNLIYNATSPITQEVEDLASNAKAAGINITLSASNFNFMIQNYIDPASPANINKWAMEDFGGESFSTYPTSFGFLNTGGSGQIGDYSDPKADALINASISSPNPAAVMDELSYLDTSLPVLWQPLRDHVYVWKTNVSATTPKAFENLTQYDPTPEFWYTTK
jgi:peptide/nickel transport system substrate-binding protein